MTTRLPLLPLLMLPQAQDLGPGEEEEELELTPPPPTPKAGIAGAMLVCRSECACASVLRM